MSRHLFIASFEREEDILSATHAVRRQGYEIKDVYSPYVVHGLDKAMGLKPSRLPYLCLAFGILGAVTKLWFQIWTSATSWALNVGGKPLASVPAFVPVTFEITVLFAGVGTVLAFIFRSKLRPGKQPIVNYKRCTNDRFVLVLIENDAAFDFDSVKQLCESHHAVEVEEQLERDEV